MVPVATVRPNPPLTAWSWSECPYSWTITSASSPSSTPPEPRVGVDPGQAALGARDPRQRDRHAKAGEQGRVAILGIEQVGVRALGDDRVRVEERRAEAGPPEQVPGADLL